MKQVAINITLMRTRGTRGCKTYGRTTTSKIARQDAQTAAKVILLAEGKMGLVKHPTPRLADSRAGKMVNATPVVDTRQKIAGGPRRHIIKNKAVSYATSGARV